MERIAYFADGIPVYWNSIVLTAAATAAICFFLWQYLGRGESAAAGFAVIPLSIVLSLVLARFAHWYSRADSYDGFFSAMTDFSSGGYALSGVFAGCALAACITRWLRLHRNLPRMLDCMAVAACAGLALGRLASFFNSSDRGQVMAKLRFLPFAYPVTNAVSGAVEYRLATFLFQSVAALVLLFVLVSQARQWEDRRDGDGCLLFLMLYGATQVVLDSTRYDSLFFRSNGFISIVQVLGALGLVLGMVTFSRWAVQKRGFRFWYILLWLGMAASLGGAGFMEYYVQRRGNEALFAYSVMSLCLSLGVGAALALRRFAYGEERRNR